MKTVKSSLSNSNFWICVLLVAYNFFSKYPFLTARDLSWDEPFSVFYSQFSVPQIIAELFKGNNPPLYELFLHYYTKVFGIGEFALRMPSLLFSCGTVIFLYATGTRLKGRWMGVFVALLFMFNSLQFFYSVAARMYALFSMLVAASVYYSVICYQEPMRKKLFFYLLFVNVLMCYTHYFAGFVIVAEAIGWLVAFRNKFFFKYTFLVFAANTVLVIPMLVFFKIRASGYFTFFEFNAPTAQAWLGAVKTLVNGHIIFDSMVTFFTVGLIIYFVVCLYRRKINLKNSYYFVLFFLMITMPIAYTWYYGNTYPLFIDRYYVYTTIPIFLFFALCLTIFFKPLGSIWAPLFLLNIVYISYQNFSRMSPDYLLREWKGATITAKQFQQESPGAIILIAPLWADLGFSYYYDRSLFKSGNNYNEDLSKRKVYRIWNSDSLGSILDKHKGSNVVLYCDENAKVDSTTDGNYRLLQRRGYVKDTSFFYAQCTTVIKLHPTR
ncbi:MAG: glycosyltransferase family 39 protein [Bacteroidetes bacterium]|nr:glycosyltransferase family 39 protein [Bacteroidota bacterium]